MNFQKYLFINCYFPRYAHLFPQFLRGSSTRRGEQGEVEGRRWFGEAHFEHQSSDCNKLKTTL